MECTLATLITCFSWSNLYFDTHVTAIDKTFPHQEWRVSQLSNSGSQESVGRYVWTDRAQNPYAGFSVGYGVTLGSVTISADVSHLLSSLQTSEDRGINAISLHARWHPFQ